MLYVLFVIISATSFSQSEPFDLYDSVFAVCRVSAFRLAGEPPRGDERLRGQFVASYCWCFVADFQVLSVGPDFDSVVPDSVDFDLVVDLASVVR